MKFVNGFDSISMDILHDLSCIFCKFRFLEDEIHRERRR